MTKVSVCIVTYNNSDIVLDCIKSMIEFSKNVHLEFFIVDNNSTDDTLEKIRQFNNALSQNIKLNILENKENLGFGKAHNCVLPLINSDFHLVLNPDIIIDYDVITNLCDYLIENKDVVLVTPKVLNKDKTEQHLPKRYPKLKYLFGRFKMFEKYRDEYTMKNVEIKNPTPIEFCTGCFMLFKTSAFKQVGGFDDRYFMYFEDTDISKKANQLGKVIFNPNEYIYHDWARSDAHNLKLLYHHIASMFKYFKKWHK